MSDEKLIEQAQTFLGEGEQVVAAGIFQPRGTTGGMMSATGAGFATDNIVGEVAGAAAGLESGRAMSHVDSVPRWTMLAVTPTTLHAIACDQHGVGWQPKETFATFDRSKARVAVHGRVNVRTLTVEDPDSDRTYQWEGNRIGPAHAKAVIEALEAEEADPPEGEE
ncbi:MAG: hypothetical protein ACRDHI_01985 [Actinomycetota bacterium]